mmetsp:Transcript_19225/g.40942  ORF Transcript_19225/g.40942 Transcript_19225/m.40942 type:complete len:81 (-) Transcript_19225:936-1178(-)
MHVPSRARCNFEVIAIRRGILRCARGVCAAACTSYKSIMRQRAAERRSLVAHSPHTARGSELAGGSAPQAARGGAESSVA